jgi:hypothetical protein
MALDNDLHGKMIRLAQQLLNGTKHGKVAWTPTDEDNKYLCTGTRSSVTIESQTDRDGDSHTTLSILNTQGTTVDSLKSSYTPVDSNNWEPESWNSILEDLFSTARRVAYNVDDAIDSLLADIEKGISAPPPRKKNSPDPWADDTGYSDEPPF